MDTFYAIDRKGKRSRLSGTFYNQNLGISLETGKGWRVTHVPTGTVIPPVTGFVSKETAEQFCESVQAALGDDLCNPDAESIKKIIQEKYEVFAEYCYRLERLGRPVTEDDLDSVGRGLAHERFSR